MDYIILNPTHPEKLTTVVSAEDAECHAGHDPFWMIAVYLRKWQQSHELIKNGDACKCYVGITGFEGSVFRVEFDDEGQAEECADDARGEFGDHYEVADNIFITYKGFLTRRNLTFFDPDRRRLRGPFDPEEQFEVSLARKFTPGETYDDAVDNEARRIAAADGANGRYRWIDTPDLFADIAPDFARRPDCFSPGLWAFEAGKAPFLMYKPGDDVIIFPDETTIQVEGPNQYFYWRHFREDLYRDYSEADKTSPIVRHQMALASAGMQQMAMRQLSNPDIYHCSHTDTLSLPIPGLDPKGLCRMFRKDGNPANMALDNMLVLCPNCMEMFSQARQQALKTKKQKTKQ